MRTAKQIAASRLNGSKSRGPKTEAGKRRSSINNLRHGLLSRIVVLDNESEEYFGMLLQQHIDKLDPADDIEFSAIEEIVSSVWRMRRLWSIEKRLFDKTVDDAAATWKSRTTDPRSRRIGPHRCRVLHFGSKPRTPASGALRIPSCSHVPSRHTELPSPARIEQS